MHRWAKFHDSTINICMRSIRSKMANSKKKISREIRRRRFSQHNTPPGSGFPDCHLHTPIRSHLLVCAETRGKMVVDIISRSRFPSRTIQTQTRKPYFLVFSLFHAMGKTKTGRANANKRSKNKRSTKASNQTQSSEQAPSNPKDSMLAEMREAGYVIQISLFFFAVIAFSSFTAINRLPS